LTEFRKIPFNVSLPLAEIPLTIQAWLLQFVDNFLAPLEMFSLGLLAGGIVSFVYGRGWEGGVGYVDR
jgi:hypothetical protein